MFRPMRRSAQQLTREQTEEILLRGSNGTLAVCGDDGYPYAVPLNYVYSDGRIYLHCAKSGHKLDAIARCDKVSFCVVDQGTVVPDALTTHFRSAIVFGRARLLTDTDELRAAMHTLSKKYAPALTDERIDKAIQSEMPALGIIVIEIEHMSGKEAIELVRQRKG